MQSLYAQATLIFAFGAAGGFTACLVKGSRNFLPRHDHEHVWQPGWTGSVLIGGIAALVIWGIYGPAAAYDVGTEGPAPKLAVLQLFASLLVGMGGSQILTLEVQKRILQSQRDTAEKAKAKTVEAFKEFLDNDPDGNG